MRVDCAPPLKHVSTITINTTRHILYWNVIKAHEPTHTVPGLTAKHGENPKKSRFYQTCIILRHHVAFRLLHASVLQVIAFLWVRTVLYLETLDDIDFAQSLTSILTACPSRICIHVLCGSLLYLAGDAVTRCPIHYLLAAFYGTMCGFYWTFIHVSIVWYKPLIITF